MTKPTLEPLLQTDEGRAMTKPTLEPLLQTDEGRATTEPTLERSPQRRDVTGAALFGSGMAVVVGGVSLMAGGVWALGAASERRDDQLAALDAGDYDDEEIIRSGLEQWYQRGRGIGMGLVVGGAALSGVGTGLIVWGGIRLRRRKQAFRYQARASVMPLVSQERVGLRTTVTF